MKKWGLVLVIALAAVGVVCAQNWGASVSVTVEGTLQLQNGQIALVNGSTVYYIPALGRYVGFIDGLKEGAGISVEGYASGNFLQPIKMTLNGKSYDFLTAGQGRGAAYGYGCGGYGYGCGGFAMGGYGSGRGGFGRGRGW